MDEDSPDQSLHHKDDGAEPKAKRRWPRWPSKNTVEVVLLIWHTALVVVAAAEHWL